MRLMSHQYSTLPYAAAKVAAMRIPKYEKEGESNASAPPSLHCLDLDYAFFSFTIQHFEQVYKGDNGRIKGYI